MKRIVKRMRQSAGTPYTKLVGSRLRTLRELKVMSQAEVAAHLRVDSSTISRWEGGDRAPTLDQLAVLVQLFGGDFNKVLGTVA